MASYIRSQATETEDPTEKLPERALWTAVLTRACLDAFKGPPMLDMSLKTSRTHRNQADYDRDQARHFFLHGGEHFREICEMAGRDPIYVQEKAKKLLLRANGWNIDVPITSHYRSRKRDTKRGPYKKKKKLFCAPGMKAVGKVCKKMGGKERRLRKKGLKIAAKKAAEAAAAEAEAKEEKK